MKNSVTSAQKKMGEYDSTNSVQMVCCNNEKWYHKLCLKKMALQMGRTFQCPSCSNICDFQENMLFNSIFIPFQGDDSSTNSNEDVPNDDDMQPKSKQRRVHKIWLHDTTFENKSDAEEAVRKDGCWSYHYSNTSDAGRRINYRCNLVKFRGKQCDAAIYVLYDSRSHKVSLFRSQSDHTHDAETNAVFKFTAEEQNTITELFELGVKPKSIKIKLVTKGFNCPPYSKLNSFLLKLRQKKYGKEKLSLGTLEKWLKENSTVPSNETEPFVLKFEIESYDANDLKFRLVFSWINIRH